MERQLWHLAQLQKPTPRIKQPDHQSSAEPNWTADFASKVWSAAKSSGNVVDTFAVGVYDEVKDHPVKLAAEVGGGLLLAGAAAEAGLGILATTAIAAVPVGVYGAYKAGDIIVHEGFGALPKHMEDSYDGLKSNLNYYAGAIETVYTNQGSEAEKLKARDALRNIGGSATELGAGIIGGAEGAFGREVIKFAEKSGQIAITALGGVLKGALQKEPALALAAVKSIESALPALEIANHESTSIAANKMVGSESGGVKNSNLPKETPESKTEKEETGSDKPTTHHPSLDKPILLDPKVTEDFSNNMNTMFKSWREKGASEHFHESMDKEFSANNATKAEEDAANTRINNLIQKETAARTTQLQQTLNDFCDRQGLPHIRVEATEDLGEASAGHVDGVLLVRGSDLMYPRPEFASSVGHELTHAEQLYLKMRKEMDDLNIDKVPTAEQSDALSERFGDYDIYEDKPVLSEFAEAALEKRNGVRLTDAESARAEALITAS